MWRYKLGHDHGADQEINLEISHGPFDPVSGKYRCSLSDATLVAPGTEVTPLTDDTELRIWHFQNSEQFLCTLQGKAHIKKEVEGV